MPPTDPAEWGHDAGLIAAHCRGAINDFEIINEPDGSWAFLGTPQQYAAILALSYAAIHAANPHAQVAIGGLMNSGATGEVWMSSVLATPGTDAIHRFDIANLHIRTAATQVATVITHWRHYFAHEGFHGPLWVTETGYPAAPAFQTEPGYQDGPAAQAHWMTTAIPAMIKEGAAMVFVTERDSLSGRYATEGVLQTSDPLTDTATCTPRPSFYAIRALAHRYAQHSPSTQATRTARDRPHVTGRRPRSLSQRTWRSRPGPNVPSGRVTDARVARRRCDGWPTRTLGTCRSRAS